MAALRVPVVAIRTADPDTLWVATQDGEQGARLSAELPSSTLFQQLCRTGDAVIDDVWAEDDFTALVDLEEFAFRFFACRDLSGAAGAAAGQLCVLDRTARTLEPHHVDILDTLGEMAQAQIKRQREAARQRRGEALRNRLQRVLKMIARDEPIDVTLEALMYLVEGQLAGPTAAMHWLDPTDRVLRPVAAPSLPHAFVDATDGLPPDAEAGSIGAAVHDGEEVCDDDVHASIHWPAMREAVAEAGFTSSWSVPVRAAAGQQVLGAVTLFGTEALTPTDEMRQTVEIAAQIAAVALERDRDRSMLEQLHRRHQHVMRQSREGMYRVDLTPPVRTDQPLEAQIRQVFERAHIAECNDTFARLHGFAQAADVVGRPVLDLYGAGQDLAQLPILRAIDHDYVMQGAQSCEVDQQGQQRWFLNTLRGVIDDGRLTAFWGGQQEVTKQKHTEYALRESEHRYRALVDLMPSPVLIHSDAGLAFANAAAADLLGAGAPDDLEGQPLQAFMPAAAADRITRQARQPDAPQHATFQSVPMERLDGTAIPMEVASSHVLYRGQPAVLSVLRRPADAPSAADARLLTRVEASGGAASDAQAESASRLTSAFMANMNHEIRTPLTALIGFAEILGDEIDHPSDLDVHELVDHIRSNGQRLLWTLDSILNLSRVEAGTLELQPRTFDMVREVEDLIDTFQLMAHEKGLRLTLDEAPDAAPLSMDRIAFERIVGNLLAHAIRETESGAVQLRVQTHSAGPEVVIEDTSDGSMAPESGAVTVAASSEDLLHRGRPGLAVAKRLLALTGGEVTVAERPQGGMRYRIQFEGATEHNSLRHQGDGVFSRRGAAPAA